MISSDTPGKSSASAVGIAKPIMLAWSIGTIAPVTLLYVINYAYMFFMTDVLGVGAALAGLLIFSLRVYDIFADPVVGGLSDRTQSRMGRRRPWMLAGGVASAVGCVLVFNLPEGLSTGASGSLGTAVIFYVLIALFLYFTGYSMFNVPYMAMPAEMTDSYHERTTLMSYRVFFVSVSGLMGVSLAPWLVGLFGGGEDAYGIMALIMAGISLVAVAICVAGTRHARSTERVSAHVALSAQIGIVLENKPFLILIAVKLLLLFQLSATTTTMFYFVVHVLHREASDVATYGLANNLAIIASLPLWLALARKWPKQSLFSASSIGLGLALLTWLVAGPGEPYIVYLLRCVAMGIFTSGSLLMGQSILPDTIAYDYWRSGLRREGIFSGIYSFVEKVAFALDPLVVGALLTIMGYQSGQTGASATQSEEAVFAIYMGMSVLPALPTLLTVVFLKFYRLTPEMLKDRSAIAPVNAAVKAAGAAD